MKTTFFSILFLLSCMSLCAQQLYFIRAKISEEHEYLDRYRPPVQVITYNPSSDTLLRVQNDYTKLLNNIYGLNELSSVTYYPRLRTFIFATGLFEKFYLLDTCQPDTLVEFVPLCPDGYEISTTGLTIIGDHWAYRCINRKIPMSEDYAKFKGVDRTLTNFFDLEATDYNDVYITGNSKTTQRVELRPNQGNMYLPIIGSIIENRPPFSVVLPEKYWVTEKTYTGIRVNDEHKTLVGIKRAGASEGEEYGSFYAALYDKGRDEWHDITLKGNFPVIMAYDRWLAGNVQDANDHEKKYFVSSKKVSPGKAARDSVDIEYPFDEQASVVGFYRPGILFLYNTETNKYIEWDTQQGDSEILLVEDEAVYYRVFNTIYKSPILNGEMLGKAELLVKDNEYVPFIHWAFFGPKKDEHKTD